MHHEQKLDSRQVFKNIQQQSLRAQHQHPAHHKRLQSQVVSNRQPQPVAVQFAKSAEQNKAFQKFQRLTQSNLDSLQLKARTASKLRNPPADAGLHFRSLPIVDLDGSGQIGVQQRVILSNPGYQNFQPGKLHVQIGNPVVKNSTNSGVLLENNFNSTHQGTFKQQQQLHQKTLQNRFMLPDLMPHLEMSQALISQAKVSELNQNQKSRRSILVDAIQGKKQNQQQSSYLTNLTKAQGTQSRFYVPKSQYQHLQQQQKQQGKNKKVQNIPTSTGRTSRAHSNGSANTNLLAMLQPHIAQGGSQVTQDHAKLIKSPQSNTSVLHQVLSTIAIEGNFTVTEPFIKSLFAQSTAKQAQETKAGQLEPPREGQCDREFNVNSMKCGEEVFQDQQVKPVKIRVRPLTMSADGMKESIDPWLNIQDQQKCCNETESHVLAKYGSVGKILAQNSQGLEKQPRKQAQSGSSSVGKQSEKGSQDSDNDLNVAVRPKTQASRVTMQTKESDKIGDHYATLNFKTAPGTRQQIKRSLINFAPDSSQRRSSVVQLESACLSSEGEGPDNDQELHQEPIDCRDELSPVPRAAEKAFEGAAENNNQNQNQEMQTITPRSFQKPPDKDFSRGESASMRAHNGRNAAPSTQVDKVVDLNQIYSRKPHHNKSTSSEQSNFNSVGSLQLQLQVRGSPKQQSQLPTRKNAFQIKHQTQQQSPSNREKNLSPAPLLEDRRQQPSASPSAQQNERSSASGNISVVSSGKPPIPQKSSDRSQQMSRALRAKEENSKHSLALKKATAEATLLGNYSTQKIAELQMHQRGSNSLNRSQVLSTYTGEGFSTGTNTTETSDQNATGGNPVVQSSAQLQRQPSGRVQPISIHAMNIQSLPNSVRPQAQINNLYRASSRDVCGEVSPSKAAEDAELKNQTASERMEQYSNFKLHRRSGSVFTNTVAPNGVEVGPLSHLNEKENREEFKKHLDFHRKYAGINTGTAPASSECKNHEFGMASSTFMAMANTMGSPRSPPVIKVGHKHVTDDFFLHQSKNSIQLRRAIDFEMKRRVQANPRLIYQATPKVSAHYWAIFDGLKQQFIHGKREYMKRECASLTKMMTAYTVIELARQYKIKLSQTKITVCGVGSNIRGTTAKLKKGDILTVEQLLYGMMLPSGNDAAFVLAKYFGRLIFDKKGYDERDMQRIRSYQFNYHPYFVKYFLKQMNDYAASLKLLNSFFDSPHGLMNPQNVSTAYDMARLTSICMQIPLFRKIVSTKTFECRALRSFQKPIPQQAPVRRHAIPIANNLNSAAAASCTSSSYEESSEQSSSVEEKFETVYVEGDHQYHWVNTNRLLGIDGITGTKTGITEAAGPCLSCSFEKDGNFIIVVLLQCKSMDSRWEEAQMLIDWAVQRRQLMAPIPQQPFGASPAFQGVVRTTNVKLHN